MKRYALFLPITFFVLTPSAQAATYVYSCQGSEMTGVNSRTPGRSGGLNTAKAFTFRMTTQGNQITNWSASGDRPAAIWVTQAMLPTVPFSQSCKIFADGNAARSCNFSLSRPDMVLMDLTTSTGNTAFLIERVGRQPFTSTFRFQGYSTAIGATGTTRTASSGTCTR